MIRWWENGERLFALFEDRVYGPQFKPLSGWDEVRVPVVGGEPRSQLPTDALTRYLYQRELPNRFLDEVREEIRMHLNGREKMPVAFESMILVPGVTAAIAAVLHAAKLDGIRTVVADAPLYFSYFRLCATLELDLRLVRRTVDDGDELAPLLDTLRHCDARKLVIITSPRYVLSTNYSSTDVLEIANLLRVDDWLVIDQAMDTEETTGLEFPEWPAVIRLRSIGKAGGLNASRLAAVIAPPSLISIFNRAGGWLYGGLDGGMLALGCSVVRANFPAQLRAVRRLASETFTRGRTIARHPSLRLVKPQNGFLGYIVADIGRLGRFRLYAHLLRSSVHAMFGVNVGLARAETSELIRVNYLLDIDESLRVIMDFYHGK